MWEIIKAGGILMLPIIGVSIVALVIIIERFLRLKHALIVPAHVLPAVLTHVQGNTVNAQVLSVLEQSPAGRILSAGVQSLSGGVDFANQQMEAAANLEMHTLEKYMGMLATVAYISPLLGLLGTVLGIIQSFLAVSVGGVADPVLLASGISQALITTAAGMFVAIPAMIAHRMLHNKINRFAVEFEQMGSQLLKQAFLKDTHMVATAKKMPSASRMMDEGVKA